MLAFEYFMKQTEPHVIPYTESNPSRGSLNVISLFDSVTLFGYIGMTYGLLTITLAKMTHLSLSAAS